MIKREILLFSLAIIGVLALSGCVDQSRRPPNKPNDCKEFSVQNVISSLNLEVYNTQPQIDISENEPDPDVKTFGTIMWTKDGDLSKNHVYGKFFELKDNLSASSKLGEITKAEGTSCTSSYENGELISKECETRGGSIAKESITIANTTIEVYGVKGYDVLMYAWSEGRFGYSFYVLPSADKDLLAPIVEKIILRQRELSC